SNGRTSRRCAGSGPPSWTTRSGRGSSAKPARCTARSCTTSRTARCTSPAIRRSPSRPARSAGHDSCCPAVEAPAAGTTMNAGGSFGRRDTVTVDREGIRLSAEGPVRIRSGEFFEMLLTVETDREIRDAVLSVAPGIWRDVTINTMIPQPTDESFEDGAFAFRFGALRAGTRLLVKVDGQVNPVYPPGRKHGTISLADGGATLASLDYAMRVLPCWTS